jgi:hypothetical protein
MDVGMNFIFPIECFRRRRRRRRRRLLLLLLPLDIVRGIGSSSELLDCSSGSQEIDRVEQQPPIERVV